jgi:hypothetical protein
MNLKSSFILSLNLKLFFFLLIPINPTFSHNFHQSEIDAKLSDFNDARIYFENRISKVFSDYSKRIQNCSNSLRNSQNSPQNVLTALVNFQTLISQISTIKNFEVYENISTCGDINKKITILDFDQRKLSWICEKINFNVSLSYKQHSELLRAYQTNLNTLGYMSNNERMVAKILSDLPNVLKVLFEYSSKLALDIANLNYFNAILSAFKESFCQCLKTVSWTGKGSTYDANIEVRIFKII